MIETIILYYIAILVISVMLDLILGEPRASS